MGDTRTDVVCLGEALVDLVAVKRGVRLDEAPAFRKAAGGAPANVAVGVARLGWRSAFLGALAEDSLGTFLCETLRRAGVNIEAVGRSRAGRTALALVSLASDGERDFLFYAERAAHFDLRLTPRMRALIQGAPVFHFGSISLIADPARSATFEAIREARRAGALCSYDPNLRKNLWPRLPMARQRMREALHLADLVKVNRAELVFLTGARSVRQGLRALIAAGPRLAVATLGAEGCAYACRGEEGRVPGFQAKIVDTTGAGDAFVAGLLTGLLSAGAARREKLPSGSALEAILLRANAAAALSTERRGGIPSLPSARRVEAMLRA